MILSRDDLSQLARDVVVMTIEELKGQEEQSLVAAPVGIDEICQHFHLPKNNVKSHKWRVSHAFPTVQKSRGARVLFIPSEERAWIQQHGRQRISVESQ